MMDSIRVQSMYTYNEFVAGFSGEWKTEDKARNNSYPRALTMRRRGRDEKACKTI